MSVKVRRLSFDLYIILEFLITDIDITFRAENDQTVMVLAQDSIKILGVGNMLNSVTGEKECFLMCPMKCSSFNKSVIP